MNVVLDSWAVMSYLKDEKGRSADTVAELLADELPIMSWINLGEVFYLLRRDLGEAEAAETVRDLRDRIDPDLPTADRVLNAARIKSDHSMSYADSFAAATAVACGAVLWTGDPELLVAGSEWRWKDLRES